MFSHLFAFHTFSQSKKLKASPNKGGFAVRTRLALGDVGDAFKAKRRKNSDPGSRSLSSFKTKSLPDKGGFAVRTRLELVTPCVTGMYSNQTELTHRFCSTFPFCGCKGKHNVRDKKEYQEKIHYRGCF